MPLNQLKPCQLQANNSGAWKSIVSFDAADTEKVKLVETGAECLQQASPRTKFRMIAADGLQTVLMHLENGQWRQA